MRIQIQENSMQPEQRLSPHAQRSQLRFRINGIVHSAISWTLDGFSAIAIPLANIRTGDAFLVTGIGCGSLDIVPVFLRCEAVRANDKEIHVRFSHATDRDRSAFRNFLVRSKALQNQTTAA